ncbi:MAG TPA: branched-chain amino acid ABC transporter permease [Baekduia sp.]|uniref:branched-chain amino acid ABC transporter permease n=1 Tax=Baekduia sp. TaxID=2600305 RepID=UPI002D766C54|nr:branched-chain amino acid ABC transporter permease [Baekduia sp.]HET6507907.1 branched-chain amino acid ABC transporter permease [Baekduia sp.]
MNFAQVLNGLALGALLMILSSGLALIYGLRGVMNFSHGALYMLGAYLAYEATSSGLSFWLALILAPLGLAVVGAMLELGFFRNLQQRSHIETGLVTFGIALVLNRLIIIVWGDDTHPVSAPKAIDGTTSVFGTAYPTYRLLIIGAAAVMAVALVLWLRNSRVGLHIRAASHDTETSGILGINVDRVSLIVVCLGAALAGLAGVLAAPYFSVSPGMGQSILITVLIVVVVGGIGSVGGAMIAALLLGLVQIMGNVWLPSVAVLVPYALLIAVLLWRPTGIAGKRV